MQQLFGAIKHKAQSRGRLHQQGISSTTKIAKSVECLKVDTTCTLGSLAPESLGKGLVWAQATHGSKAQVSSSWSSVFAPTILSSLFFGFRRAFTCLSMCELCTWGIPRDTLCVNDCQATGKPQPRSCQSSSFFSLSSVPFLIA